MQDTIMQLSTAPKKAKNIRFQKRRIIRRPPKRKKRRKRLFTISFPLN